jgi:hypothetical protein
MSGIPRQFLLSIFHFPGFRFCQEGSMIRERALKIVLVGLIFLALAYPMVVLRQDEALQMMLSVYVRLGIFLLLAARNPSAYRSVIAFAAWSSIAHAVLMGAQGLLRCGPACPFPDLRPGARDHRRRSDRPLASKARDGRRLSAERLPDSDRKSRLHLA